MSALIRPPETTSEIHVGTAIRTEPKMTRPTGNTLSRELQAIVDRVRVLRGYTARTGFRTTRSEKEILARLGPDDLAAVLLTLENGTDNDGNHIK